MNKHVHHKQVIERLSKIEGHVRGIKKMAEDGKECEDVLIQISAVMAALRNLSVIILQDHLDHCIVDAIKEGKGGKTLEDFANAIKHVVK
jgi:DNA-binding FrmR family transcriptional regulator